MENGFNEIVLFQNVSVYPKARISNPSLLLTDNVSYMQKKCTLLFYRVLFQTSSMSIMISSDTKMKYLGIQKENLMKVRRTVHVEFVLFLFL